MVILKTKPQTIVNVVKHSKHALDKRPNLTPGDLILISQTIADTSDGIPPIRYLMEYVRIYEDKSGESIRIWKKRWKYIIEGKNCKQLKRPFNISRIQISGKNYGQGGPLSYVDEKDAQLIIEKGYLKTI